MKLLRFLILFLFTPQLFAGALNLQSLRVPSFLGSAPSLKGYTYGINPKAKVTVVEFSAFECPLCLHFHNEVFPHIKRKYVDTKKVNWVVIPYPVGALSFQVLAILDKLPAKKRLSFADAVMKKAAEWNHNDYEEHLKRLAKGYSLSPEAIKDALSQPSLQLVAQYVLGISKFPVEGTPTFFVNGLESNDQLVQSDIEKQLAATK